MAEFNSTPDAIIRDVRERYADAFEALEAGPDISYTSDRIPFAPGIIGDGMLTMSRKLMLDVLITDGIETDRRIASGVDYSQPPEGLKGLLQQLLTDGGWMKEGEN